MRCTGVQPAADGTLRVPTVVVDEVEVEFTPACGAEFDADPDQPWDVHDVGDRQVESHDVTCPACGTRTYVVKEG